MRHGDCRGSYSVRRWKNNRDARGGGGSLRAKSQDVINCVCVLSGRYAVGWCVRMC